MRILVTGGAGFIGSAYIRRLLGRPDTDTSDTDPSTAADPGTTAVTVLDALTYAGNKANLDGVCDDPRLTFVRGNILDVDLVDQLVAGADQVVHFAAESHVDRSIYGARDFVLTNALGTQTLLEAALRHGVDRFVQVSTDEVYGSIEHGSWTEEQPLKPNSPYAASKAAGDLIARSYHRTYGLPVMVTRCSNNYGPFHFPEKMIPLFVTSLIEGRHVPLYGDGLNVRDWLHVDDHCRGIDLVRRGGRPGEVYNIGGGTELTNLELTQQLLTACGAGWGDVDYVTDRLGHDRRYSVDCSKIADELGYAPQVPFAEGLADVVRWYREHEDWWRPLKARAALPA